jgi:thymidylate synthase
MMNRSGTQVIQDTNLSRAWARAFLALNEPGVTHVTPLVVTINGLSNRPAEEDEPIRQELEKHLRIHNHQGCHTVANTIFPKSLWNPLLDRSILYKRYLDILPRLKQASTKNRYGLYFERLIHFEGNYPNQDSVNQLEYVITTYLQGNRRGSALQASVIDPYRDHTHARQRGFPCLQQVSFAVHNKRELCLTGYYATQYYFERAYGNFLGLCDLGWFMAQEMKLHLSQVTCIAADAQLGNIGRGEIRPLSTFIHSYLYGQERLFSSLDETKEAA